MNLLVVARGVASNSKTTTTPEYWSLAISDMLEVLNEILGIC